MKALLSTIGTDNLSALAEKFTPKDGVSPSRPTYPQGVAPHLDSHQAQLTDLIARGEIDPSYENVLRGFIELHDRGYAGETRPLTAEDFAAHVDDYKKAYVGLGATEAEADQMAEYVLRGLQESNPVKQHLVGRVIGHAVNSVRFAVKEVKDTGLTDDEAYALSALYATHHLGYPLTPLVDGFAKVLGSPIPANLRGPFFVGGEDVPMLTAEGKPISALERERISQDRADTIRAETADRVAGVLNITKEESRTIAAVEYALDRMTPARRMREFTLNPDGSYLWTGGETEKRYPLIVGNIDGMFNNPAITEKPEKNLRSVYNLSVIQFKKERNAAVQTAANLEVTGLKEMILRNSAREIGETALVQGRCLKIADKLGVGDFATIKQDIERVTAEYRRVQEAPVDGDDIEALGYLLGTLRVIQPRVEQLFPNT